MIFAKGNRAGNRGAYSDGEGQGRGAAAAAATLCWRRRFIRAYRDAAEAWAVVREHREGIPEALAHQIYSQRDSQQLVVLGSR
jgi:hypothetical protein